MRGEWYVWSGSDCPSSCPTILENLRFSCAEHGYIAMWHDPNGEHHRRARVWYAPWRWRWFPQGERLEIPRKVYDELVVMRFAEMLEDGSWRQVVERVAKAGTYNFGAVALAELLGFDPGETWARETEQRVEEHLRDCDGSEPCDSPGYHRHGHKRYRVRS